MQSLAQKPCLSSVLQVVKEKQEDHLKSAYDQALNLLKIGFEETQKRNETLMKKLFFASELSSRKQLR